VWGKARPLLSSFRSKLLLDKFLVAATSFLFPSARPTFIHIERNRMKQRLVIMIGVALICLARIASAEDKITLRFGHFPNITHAQGVIAHALSRQHKGWFEERVGPGFEVQWFTYNAGPSAMEAIFAGSLDLTYVGQGPALNAHLKSNGEEIRILAG